MLFVIHGDLHLAQDGFRQQIDGEHVAHVCVLLCDHVSCPACPRGTPGQKSITISITPGQGCMASCPSRCPQVGQQQRGSGDRTPGTWHSEVWRCHCLLGDAGNSHATEPQEKKPALFWAASPSSLPNKLVLCRIKGSCGHATVLPRYRRLTPASGRAPCRRGSPVAPSPAGAAQGPCRGSTVGTRPGPNKTRKPCRRDCPETTVRQERSVCIGRCRPRSPAGARLPTTAACEGRMLGHWGHITLLWGRWRWGVPGTRPRQSVPMEFLVGWVLWRCILFLKVCVADASALGWLPAGMLQHTQGGSSLPHSHPISCPGLKVATADPTSSPQPGPGDLPLGVSTYPTLLWPRSLPHPTQDPSSLCAGTDRVCPTQTSILDFPVRSQCSVNASPCSCTEGAFIARGMHCPQPPQSGANTQRSLGLRDLGAGCALCLIAGERMVLSPRLTPLPPPGLTTRSCCITPPSASCPVAGAWAPSASWRHCRYQGAVRT